MHSTIRKLAGAAVLVGVTALITGRVVSQHEGEGGQMSEEWAKWMELAKPGKAHQDMVRRAGTWSLTVKHWMDPASEPEVSTGVSEKTAILGGRFVLEKVRGDKSDPMSGQIFEGMGIYGFDNATQKHLFAWVDNHGTAIMTGEGTADPTGKVITYLSEYPGPDAVLEIKSVTRIESDDRYVYESFIKQEGQWARTMEISAIRKRAGG